MNDLEVVRAHILEAQGRCEGIDPQLALRLVDALLTVQPELMALRSITADLDELMDGEQGDLFQPDHSCRVQRRVAQFWRENWRPNAAARGYQEVRHTYGRGKGPR